MKDIADKYLLAFDVGGILLLVNAVVKDEMEDDFVAKTSKIVNQPEFACRRIAMAIFDTKPSVMRGILTGTIFRDHLVPKPSEFPGPGWQLASTSFSSNATQTTDGSWSVKEILDAEVVDGEMKYQILWSTDEITTEPASCLLDEDENITCPDIFKSFYSQNPNAPRHGRKNLSKTLIQLKKLEHITYMHAFVCVEPDDWSGMFLNPTTEELLEIVEVMEAYLADIPPPNSPFYQDRIRLIRGVDLPDDEYKISTASWDRTMARKGFRRHIQPDITKGIKESRRKALEKMVETMKATFDAVPSSQRHLPFHRPIFEVGLTVNPIARMKQHANHSGTTPGLAFFECASLYQHGGKYRWVYLPIARPKEPEDVPFLESFFSRALQAYIHQGGVNCDPAGTSMTSGNNMVLKEKSAAADTVDFDTFRENLAWTYERFALLEGHLTSDDREKVKRDLENVENEIKQLKAGQVLGWFTLVNNLNKVTEHLKDHLPVLKKALDMAKLEAKLGEMEELRRKMERLGA